MTVQAISPFDIGVGYESAVPACRWPNCSAHIAISSSTTTRPADFCTRHSIRVMAISRESGIGGIKLKVGQPNLKIMDLAARHGRKLVTYFAIEIHIHSATTYPIVPWLEHFEWLNPLFNEPLELREGRRLPHKAHSIWLRQLVRYAQITIILATNVQACQLSAG